MFFRAQKRARNERTKIWFMFICIEFIWMHMLKWMADFYCDRMLFSFLYQTQSISIRMGHTRTIEMKKTARSIRVQESTNIRNFRLLYYFWFRFQQALERWYNFRVIEQIVMFCAPRHSRIIFSPIQIAYVWGSSFHSFLYEIIIDK